MSKLSFNGAIDHLRTMFGRDTSGYIDVETIYRNTGLDKTVPEEREKLYNRLSAMRHHNLIVKEYEVRNGTKVIKGLRLTPSGYLAVYGDMKDKQSREVTVASWRADAETLQARYPEFEVVYDIRLKKKQG